jgi:mannose-6-phosphate isomerase class I
MGSNREDIWRMTTQHLAPHGPATTEPGQYNMYPAFPVSDGSMSAGFDGMAERLAGAPTVRIDGYVGVFWDQLRDGLDRALRRIGVQARWIDVSQALRPEAEIDTMIEPFLGGDDPVFGTRFSGGLADFFDKGKLAALRPETRAPMSILYGCGAGLADWDGPLVYVDLPKNELQYRSRAGKACNLGSSACPPPKVQYKRFYFVDWVALNRHKRDILPHVDWFVDGQRPREPVMVGGEQLRRALSRMARNYFRVRPWFEPGPWGGQWIRRHVPQASDNVPNYAWSFELIVPENGLMFTDGEHLLEVSFDWLMYRDHRAVLGDCAARFGHEFPIRFDFLDTFGGGNLSVQCHPRPEYMTQQFGENFTQDESYYVLDCKPGAGIFLGFQEGLNPDALRSELERSARDGTEVDIRRFINCEPSQRHGLYLIPNGTVHSSGANNMVLEISATPYIFTFKMYDWLRPDLDGAPRALHIDRAWENLHFERQGRRVREHLVSRPKVIDEGTDWRLVHLPTHAEHFYDMHRYEFDSEIVGRTDGSCHVMNLVEGSSVLLETSGGMRQRFNYAETFVVPAAADKYRLVNEGNRRAMVVKVFVKSPDAGPRGSSLRRTAGPGGGH